MAKSINYARDTFGGEMQDPTRGLKLLPEDVKSHCIPTDDEINTVLSICNYQQKLLVSFV